MTTTRAGRERLPVAASNHSLNQAWQIGAATSAHHQATASQTTAISSHHKPQTSCKLAENKSAAKSSHKSSESKNLPNATEKKSVKKKNNRKKPAKKNL